jgi:RNA recognition motif-containing protein
MNEGKDTRRSTGSGILKGLHGIQGLLEPKVGDAPKKEQETSLGSLNRAKVFHKNTNRKNMFEEKFGSRAVNFNLKKKLATVFKRPEPADPGKTISAILLERLERETNEAKWNQIF